MSLGLWVPQACPFPGHPNVVPSKPSSLLTALTSRLPLRLREDREGPCLPIGHIPGASLWRQVIRASSVVDTTLAEPHLGDCPVAAGSCQPTPNASPGDRKHSLPHLPRCQQGILSAPRGAVLGGVLLDLLMSALPSLLPCHPAGRKSRR